MRRQLGMIFGLTAACAAGCGGSGPPATRGVPASHGGTLLPLPDGSGFVEVVVEPDNPKGGGPKAKGRLVMFFLNRDGSGPPTPAPAGVTFTDDAGKTYPLSPKAAADSARFESAAATFPVGRDLSGELKATTGGRAVSIPVAVR